MFRLSSLIVTSARENVTFLVDSLSSVMRFFFLFSFFLQLELLASFPRRMIIKEEDEEKSLPGKRTRREAVLFLNL